LLFGDFLLAKQEKVTRCRATPGLCPQPKHAFQTSTPQLRQAQPERTGVPAPACQSQPTRPDGVTQAAFSIDAARQPIHHPINTFPYRINPNAAPINGRAAYTQPVKISPPNATPTSSATAGFT